MASTHAKRIRISAGAFKALCGGIGELEYSPKRREGFKISGDTSAIRLIGRYMFNKVQKVAVTNPQSLEPEIIEQPVMLTCNFSINTRTGLIRCNERRADLKLLGEAFGQIEGVQLELEDFNADPVELFKAVRESHKKVDLKSLRIKDYLGREGLLTTANFKLMQAEENEIFRKFQDNVQAFSASISANDGRHTLSVARNGSIRYSDELPEDILEETLNFLPQFHEEVEVETVEV